MDNIEADRILIGDELYIAAKELLRYGVISNHNDEKQYLRFNKRINIDYLKKEFRGRLGKFTEKNSVFDAMIENHSIYNSI